MRLNAAILAFLTYDPPKPFLGTGDLEVISISETEICIKNRMIAKRCYNVSGDLLMNKSKIEYGNQDNPFLYSAKNRFLVVGCDSEGYNTGFNLYKGAKMYNDCYTSCKSREEGACNGHGCCKNTIFEGTKRFTTEIDQTEGTLRATFLSFSPCTHAFVST